MGGKTEQGAGTMRTRIVAILATSFLMSPTASAEEPIIAQAKEAISKMLHDPSSAQFLDLRVVKTGDRDSVCGYINAKNRMGGYDGRKPFLLDPITSIKIIYGGGRVTDDTRSQMAPLKGFEDQRGRAS